MSDNTVAVCLGLILSGTKQFKKGDHPSAERAFAAVLAGSTRVSEPNPSSSLRALALYNLSLLRDVQGRWEHARQGREQAAALLDGVSSGPEQMDARLRPLFQELMAEVLVDAREYRRAIPYCEASIQNVMDVTDDPVAIAEVVWRAGKCYSRLGLRDHAAVPLRHAVKIFRTLAGDPRLSAALLDLGNALRKANPVEAERCYHEAADFHTALAQFESAAPAWVNLGVLCSEQGRYPESLSFYQKALRVRELSSGTPAERMGMLLNNIANVQRRMGQFAAAHESINRAIPILETVRAGSLPNAYGTRGLIFRDEGKDEDAVVWFRRSAIEHRKQPSPNLDTLCDELENEAASLKRLGRIAESKSAEQQLEAARALMAEVPAVERELGEIESPADGAVLIELAFGIRHSSMHSDLARLQARLADALEPDEIGSFAGQVTIPEATTLMFYGADAEIMFRRLQPLLVGDPMCTGGRVIVRQGVTHREVLLPASVM